MKSSILLLIAGTLAFSSCTTAYKTGQTPDDVYYSPDRPQDEYVRVNNDNDRRYQNDDEDYYEDRYLRMKVRNRYQWNDLDDYYFYNNRYAYSYYNTWGYWNNPWNPYLSWNYYYNPYCTNSHVVVGGGSYVNYNRPRVFNLNTYNTQVANGNYSNSHSTYTNGNYNNNTNRPTRTYNNSYNNNNSNSGAGNTLRNIFNGSSSNNSSSGSSNNNNSSSSSSSSSSGSSSGSSGSSAPVRRF